MLETHGICGDDKAISSFGAQDIWMLGGLGFRSPILGPTVVCPLVPRIPRKEPPVCQPPRSEEALRH